MRRSERLEPPRTPPKPNERFLDRVASPAQSSKSVEPDNADAYSTRLAAEDAELKRTVLMLREELERGAEACEERVANAVAERQREMDLLHETVTALRDGLERLGREKEEAVHQERVRAHTEQRQLRETVAALRERLEALMDEKEEAVRRAKAEVHHEIRQLKETVVALRQALE
jgi:signal transduction histidine kinase